ncbi:hypothetical protein [Streptomyces noursei]|uniref:hypothetical protein n=1 Tax=Streptomyces noursei TaxID=1971 RepID=UPI00167288D6|nr:hypothetical protein [Streptomyces noursei]MCZ1019885.1 hypothetical protein [Streptomyces noursei]GGX34064.1 hypothetical protein GCM10010341_64470 [Streptomyces noursei]
MSNQANIQGNLQQGVGEVSGMMPKWRRRLICLGVYGLFAALAGTAVTATAAPAVPSQAAAAPAVSITCANGTGSVVKTDEDPGKPVEYQAKGTCAVTGTQTGTANGTATFSIPPNTCASATTTATGTVTWPSGQTSTVSVTVKWVATAGHGISANIVNGSITKGLYNGAVVAGTGVAPEQVRLNCLTTGTFEGATGSGSGTLAGKT